MRRWVIVWNFGMKRLVERVVRGVGVLIVLKSVLLLFMEVKFFEDILFDELGDFVKLL